MGRIALRTTLGTPLIRYAGKWDEPGKKCEYCSSPPTYAIRHSEGMAYVQTCDKHLQKGKGAAAACVPYGGSDPSNIDKVKKIAMPAPTPPLKFAPFQGGDDVSQEVIRRSGYDPDYYTPNPGVAAYHQDKMVGHVEWGGPQHRYPDQVQMIKVDPEYRRHGIATSLYDWAKQNVNPGLHHSDLRSDLGGQWVDHEVSRTGGYYTRQELRERGERYMREHPNWREEPGLRDWARILGFDHGR